jgi:hypothetical protein
MSQNAELRHAQQRTIRLLNYEDGLWDILLGLVFMLLALYPITRALLGPAWNMGFFLAALALLIVLYTVARRAIAGPRMGIVKPRRTPALKIALAVIAILVVLTLGLVLLTLFSPSWLPGTEGGTARTWLSRYWVDIIALFFIAGVFSMMGYLFGVGRLYLYGWLVGIGNLASTALYSGWGAFNLPLGIASGIIIITGACLLARFLRRYPAHPQEA